MLEVRRLQKKGEKRRGGERERGGGRGREERERARGREAKLRESDVRRVHCGRKLQLLDLNPARDLVDYARMNACSREGSTIQTLERRQLPCKTPNNER